MTIPRISAIISDIPPNSSVLDVGVVQHNLKNTKREEWLHQHIVDHADHVLGIDILENEIEALRSEGYNVGVADAETLDLNDKFEIIVAGELIEHLSNPGRFIESAGSHLLPDGKLLMTTPNPWGFVHRRRAITESPPCNPEHICWFDEKTLSQLLDRHGFDCTISYLKPPERGMTSFLYRVRAKALGSTHLYACATKR